MATLPSFRTWVAGEIVTAAYFNTNVRDAGNFFLSWPVFEGRQTVAQALASGANTALLFDTEDIDTDNGHSTVTNTDRYTPQTAGRFQISGKVSFAANATSYRGAVILKNGAVINGADTIHPPISGVTHRQATPTLTQLANGTTDYFQIAGTHAIGAPLNTSIAAVEQPTFSVRMVGTS